MYAQSGQLGDYDKNVAPTEDNSRMAIKQLTEEQVRTMTVEQKDRWWLENVYKGDIPQFTARAAICGFLLGGVLSVTNLYIGAKTGWALGVGITSVILSFLIFRVLSRLGMGRNYHVLENNILQSIACSAGYTNGPLIASMAAFMIITGVTIPWWQMMVWCFTLALLGVLFAFPLKRRFINDEQLPFPEGQAAGVVLDTLHSESEGNQEDAVLPAKLLVYFSGLAGLLKLLQAHPILDYLRLKVLSVPEFLDNWYYNLCQTRSLAVPSLNGIPLKELTIRPELDVAMFGAGGLMGIRTGVSLLVGAIISYGILAPIMIAKGDIHGVADADGIIHYGFRPIMTWGLWCGVTMMTTASLMSFFAKPSALIKPFKQLFSKSSKRSDDCLANIEFPLWLAIVGVPLVGAVLVLEAHFFFDVKIWMGAIAVPMVFVFTLIAVNSTALTSITPTGALGKITQLTYGAIAPGNIKTNIATACISAEVAGSASNLIQNIKPGYMLGGKPRLQACGHVLGALSGAIFSVGIFYALFLPENPAKLISPEFPYPAATAWKAVAELLTTGLDQLPITARWAAVIGGIVGILLEGARMAAKGKIPLSPVGIGLAFIIPFNTCLAMFMGSFTFWLIAKLRPNADSAANRIFVKNQESICAGIIAGAALMGVAIMAVVLFLLDTGGGH